MVEFRKVFLTLAGMVVATGLASAQTPALQCVATSGNPPPVRSEGIAEEVGQVVINCTGGKPVAAGAPIPTINVQIFLNTNLTSRLLDSNGRSEALLLIDEPTPANQLEALTVPNTVTFLGNGDGTYIGGAQGAHPTIFGAQQSGPNSVTWLNVPFDPPGTTGNRVLRLVNVRANASMLPTPVLSGISPVSMFISVSGAILPINNTQLTVGYAQRGMVFQGLSDDSGNFRTVSINQCEPGDRFIVSQFVEQFATAFRTKGGAGQNGFNVSYNTESMFTTSGLTGISASAGLATQATRLSMRFTNIPANVAIRVPTTITSDRKDAAGNVIQINDTAVLVSADGSSADPASGDVTLTGGSGQAVWEITVANTASINTIPVPVRIRTTGGASVPGLGAGTIAGNYAPVSATMTASGGAAPRFVENPTTGNTITFNSCRTNLLFPFVTNQANFDTGIVISNTSADTFGTTKQSGACTLNYYSATNAPAAQTSSSIAAGDQLIFTVSAGNSAQLIAPTPAFQGYVIATCNFQYAHGYAFVSTPTQGGLSNGYLALVLDTPKAASRTGATSEPLNN